MNLLFWGMTVSVAGKVLLAVGVLRAHQSIEKEHGIDDKVIRSFHKERAITVLGLILILVGYFMEITFFGGFGNILTCEGPECAALLNAAVSN